MNGKRRKELGVLLGKLSEVKESLKNILAAEETAFDNMPESLQESERGEQMQECIEMMDNAMTCIEEAHGNIEEVINQ